MNPENPPNIACLIKYSLKNAKNDLYIILKTDDFLPLSYIEFAAISVNLLVCAIC
jgi:hypothetical protein